MTCPFGSLQFNVLPYVMSFTKFSSIEPIWLKTSLLTSLGDIELNSCWNTIAWTTSVVSFIFLACITECQLAFCCHMTCCISCHLNTPFHMVIDHPIIVIPEYVLGRSGSWAQHTCQWYRGSLIHMILFSTLDVGLRIDNIEMNSSWNCPSWSWHLTLIDSSVSVLDKLYLQNNFVLIEYIPSV